MPGDSCSINEEYPLILNAGHVAELLGVSKRFAYELMDQQNFPLIKIGKTKRVTKEAFFLWLSTNNPNDK